MRPPVVRVVVVGDELLSGRIADTNTTFLARELGGIGLAISGIQTVPDREDAIRAALRATRADVMFVCGGLGPTPDDRTLAAVAREFGLRLKTDPGLLAKVRERFRRLGKPMPKTARRQALVPAGARLLPNRVGMVPGMAFGVKRIGVASPDFERIGVASPDFVVMLPGVPEEFQSIVRDGVVPLLKERFKLKPPESATLRTFGVPESWLAERLARPMRGRPRVRPAFYPSTTGVDVVLRAPAGTDLTFLRERVFRTLGEAVYEVGERSMAEVVGALLRERKQTVASAESCTGGLTGDWLTNVAGSSDWFLGGVVAYSNELKTLLCGVRAATLDRHGAVSPETAAEMARGARLLAGASYGLAVSGIAGPSGGSDKKPVGLAYVAVASARGTRVEKHVFDGDRRMVKEQSAMAALDLLRRELRAKAEGRRRRSEGTTRRRAEG